MEPVPETERMEEFKTAAVPTLRILETNDTCQNDLSSRDRKPPTIRRSTEPTPSSPRSPITTPSPSIPYRSRNTSPFSRGHLRSKSSTMVPTMSRTQSLPGFNAAGHLLASPHIRPSSPMGSPNRVRAPRKPVDDVFPGLPKRLSREVLRDISETGDVSEEHTPRATEWGSSPVIGLPPAAGFRARRPSSPLRHLAQQNAIAASTAPSTPSSVNSSPSYPSYRFNDSFLGTSSYTSTFSYPGSYGSSSVPSTPTSTRSRSPSISSLETIPDTPDAEEAALEAERMAQLKAAADAADGEESKTKSDTAGSRGRTLGTTFGRDKRKRWSVCGAERRGDLNLDTIWED
ncbi:uncharacterized protein L3040_008862 [Drepanopeziza brunnea f. sp. 'multigermtubi']|uniref:Basic proline-rich protein n=1 Tax=Marssonina brunnea f. sp. multigermtubi (strain MB_m1) TaxID=1072389 RepID=K1X922_MARBU|nr:uncharacterized protein MBM_04795 [Drepanopeziza brunnea f. sp. 'multigermtubi' MB_m1]EKD17218.1 hypothetical protein MBM_04795 [Drepanopeziza brunnea f. sp. 'multigermtubi' MB_m1]KAJ5032254.1 hypothetical protein L3040_008862 [Drepanopeziza brunnea f. sp. 'multigermtubi']